jgi:hypothetical protein
MCEPYKWSGSRGEEKIPSLMGIEPVAIQYDGRAIPASFPLVYLVLTDSSFEEKSKGKLNAFGD